MKATRREFMGGVLAIAVAPLVAPLAVVTAQVRWLNVKHFGARGDGKTDDTAAIQAALNAAGPDQSVYFPAGVYCTSSPVQGVSDLSVGDRCAARSAQVARSKASPEGPLIPS